MMIVVFDGATGGDPTAQEAATVAEEATDPDDPDRNFPVLYKKLERIQVAMPHSGATPNICIIGPDREILQCVAGHGTKEDVADFVRRDAGS